MKLVKVTFLGLSVFLIGIQTFAQPNKHSGNFDCGIYTAPMSDAVAHISFVDTDLTGVSSSQSKPNKIVVGTINGRTVRVYASDYYSGRPTLALELINKDGSIQTIVGTLENVVSYLEVGKSSFLNILCHEAVLE